MENQNKKINLPTGDSTKESSLLDTIIKEATIADTPTHEVQKSEGVPDDTKILKKKEAVSYSTVMKFIGTLFFVAMIFFGSFLAYIVFNPNQVQFFVNFGINPNDVKILLKQLVNAIFGFIVVIVSILWIYLLFKAIWTSKELKRQKLMRWLIGGFTGIILFSLISIWAFLTSTINATDYSNPAGTILLFDHDLWSQENSQVDPRLYSSSELIGPIRILFDISANAKFVQDKNLLTIESYSISFDGAKNSEGELCEISGSNPINDKTIICTFDDIKTYNPQGKYLARDRAGTPIELDMYFPSIEVRGLVDIKKQRNKDNKNIITFDASSLRSLGSPRWIYANGMEVIKPSITEVEGESVKFICLKVLSEGCDRIFVITANRNQENIGKISAQQDSSNGLIYNFRLENLTINENEITEISWTSNDRNLMCKNNEKFCTYTFDTYGAKEIQVKILLANGEVYILDSSLHIEEPLKLIRNVKVYDENGMELNTVDTYDATLKAFVLKNILIPARIRFDARDIVPAKSGYTIEKIEWDITTNKARETKIGEIIDLEISDSSRYSIVATYTFSYLQGENRKTTLSRETIIIDTENKNLLPILSLSQSSDYAPSTIYVDASASRSKNGEIKKFIFDFGEGRLPVEGDSQQTYEYLTAGEKTITLTIISISGEKETIAKKIIIKDPPREINFMPSISPGIVGKEIDFVPINVSGQIEEYVWNFSDGTPVVRGMNPTHIFKAPGNYSISLTVRFVDGTKKSEIKEYLVEASLRE